MSGLRWPHGRRVGPLRRALGIPYSWPETITWPLRCAFPAPLPRHGFTPLPPKCALRSSDAPSVRIAFLGDLMPTPGNLTLDVGTDLRSVLGEADLVVANCESPLAETSNVRGTRFQLEAGVLARHVEALGVSPERLLLSLANNHAEDRGTAGLVETARRIEGRGARVVGLRQGETDAPVVVVDGSLRVGVAAWTHWRNRPAQVAAPRPWTAEDVERADWQALRRDFRLDCLVGFPHWDLEFRHAPQAATRRFAHTLLARGFDVLVGHHPHVIQGVEEIGPGLVLYSCGNAISNDSLARRWTCRLGVIFALDVYAGGSPRFGYRVLPYIDKRSGRTARLRSLGGPSSAVGRERVRFDVVFPPCPAPSLRRE